MHENTQKHVHSHLPIHMFTPRLGSGCDRTFERLHACHESEPSARDGPHDLITSLVHYPNRLRLAEAAPGCPWPYKLSPRPSPLAPALRMVRCNLL